MAATPVCLVCQVEMEKGFLTEMGDYSRIFLPRWCPGEAKSSFWTGEAGLAQRKAGFTVTAFRCPTCEALRLYAPSAESSAH